MRRLIPALLMSSLLALPVIAQSKPQTREGFTISFGLGGGSAGFTCNGCASDRESGGTGYLRMGGTFRPNLILGGEINAFTKDKTEQGVKGTMQISYGTAFAQWYPQPTTGFFVKGGLGFGAVKIDAVDQSSGLSATMESTGLAISLGAGFDWRMGKNFSLSPFANFLTAGGGEARINGGGTGENLGANIFQLGLGFTWH